MIAVRVVVEGGALNKEAGAVSVSVLDCSLVGCPEMPLTPCPMPQPAS